MINEMEYVPVQALDPHSVVSHSAWNTLAFALGFISGVGIGLLGEIILSILI